MPSTAAHLTAVLATLLGAAHAQSAASDVDVVHVTEVRGAGPRVLGVVAHPDDEVAFGGALYKIATHLGGACDIVVITNGEAGYKYSLLAERIYGKRLTDPAVGRRELPAIRQREMTEAARILGVRDLYFLHQTDHRYTQDPQEVLGPDAHVWDLALVRATLRARLVEGRYDFVFVHVPTPEVHGHHQAATILALEAIAELTPDRRPVALGAAPTTRDAARPTVPDMLVGFPVTRHYRDVAPFTFDRTQPFGFRDRLDYRVVTNLAMAQHRSQGTYQLGIGRFDAESYVLFALHTPDAVARAEALFTRLREPQFAPIDYDADGALIERR